jgi:hypothetical protein
MTANLLELGKEADFEALILLPALNLIRSTKLHLSTEPPLLQTPVELKPYRNFYLHGSIYIKNIMNQKKFK